MHIQRHSKNRGSGETTADCWIVCQEPDHSVSQAMWQGDYVSFIVVRYTSLLSNNNLKLVCADSEAYMFLIDGRAGVLTVGVDADSRR